MLDNLEAGRGPLAGPRRLGAQEAGDTADDGVGVLLPALGRLHQPESTGFHVPHSTGLMELGELRPAISERA